jgi:hypothetical protein
MAKVKLGPGQYISEVLNPGIDKRIPIGAVDMVYNQDGSPAGFVKDGKVVPLGYKEPASTTTTKAKPKNKTPEAESSRLINAQLQDLKNNLKAAKDGILTEPVGSTLYNKYKALIPKREAEIAALTVKFDKAKAAEKIVSDKTTTASTVASTKGAIERLNEQRQRLVDLGGDTTKIDAQIAEAQGKIQTLTAPTGPTGTGPTGNKTLTLPKLGTGVTAGKTGPSGPSGTPAASKTPGAPVVTPPTAEEAHAKAIAALQSLGNMGAYTIQMALIDSDPSLKDIFYNNVYLPISQGKPPADPGKFQADLINSDWYKSYAGPARIAQAAKYGDPATWKLSVAEAEKIVINEAQGLGYTLDPTQVSSLADFALNSSGGKAESITGLVLTGLKKQITTIGNINTAGGLAATGVSGLKTTAANYLVGHLFNDDWYKSQEDSILKGITTQSAVESMIKSAAKSTYSSISDQIDAGLKPKDVLLPNVNRIANILEIDPSQVDVTNPKYAKLIFTQDPKDPSKQIFKSSWQSEIDAKKTDDWAYTKNSRESLDSVARSVLTSLGMTY